MILSQKALDALKDRSVRLDLALALDFGELWINRLIDANKDNGPLTTVKAVDTLKKVTGLSLKEILVDTENNDEKKTEPENVAVR